MLRKYTIATGKVTEAQDGAATVYLYTNPDEAERKALVTEWQIDEHTLNSALDPDEPSRLEIDEFFTAIILKRPKNYSGKDQLLFKVASMGLFYRPDKLVIVISEDIPMFTGKLYAQVPNLADLLMKILYTAIHHYMEHLKIINMISEEIERKLAVSMDNRHLINMFTLEKSLVYYVSAINSNGYVFERLKHQNSRCGFDAPSIEMLDDVIVENSQCMRQAQIYANILSGLMQARSSIMSNNLNYLMKNLNALVIAIAVPSFFAGVGGMSEFSTITGGAHKWYITYPAFLLAMLAIGYFTFWVIRRFERH